MSAPTAGTDCGKHLVDLIINQDHVSHNWLQFLITIEAGLVVGLFFIVRPGASGQVAPEWFSRSAIVLISGLGAVFAIALTRIVVRERRWQAYYAQQFNSLPEHKGMVFPADKAIAGPPDEQPIGTISKVVVVLAAVIVVAWVLVGLALLCGSAQPKKPLQTAARTFTGCAYKTLRCVPVGAEGHDVGCWEAAWV